MSRRFGRNQKRALREEIAKRDREVERLSAVAAEHWQKMRQEAQRADEMDRSLVEWASRVLALLGPESAFTRDVMRRAVDEREWEMSRRELRMRGYPADRGVMRSPPGREMVEMSLRVLDLFVVAPEKYLDELSGRVRFEIVSPDGRAALVLDELTLSRLRSSEDASLIRFLTTHLVEPWAGGRVPQGEPYPGRDRRRG